MSTVGYKSFELRDPVGEKPIRLPIVYPANEPEEKHSFGAFAMSVAMNAPVNPGRYPLVLISHGSGGHHLVYRTLAKFLAQHGFIVAMPEHPGNNRRDNSQERSLENLVNRPRHISLVIDWLLASPEFAPHLVPDRIYLIGHSMGGYTALAVAGGVPSSFEHAVHRLEVVHDSRVKALVLFAPATRWFEAPGALDKVRVPILMIFGDEDEYTPSSIHGKIISDGLPDKSNLEEWIVENGGHFSFLSPFPPAMTTMTFRPAMDPPGFDRAKFQEQLQERVLEFLTRQLVPAR